MGRLGPLLSLVNDVINDVKVRVLKTDLGNELVTGELYSDSGDDSPPMNNDELLLVEYISGKYVVVGSIDPSNLQKAAQGERRFYARNENGEQVNEVWLKNTGEVVVENEAGITQVAGNGAFSHETDNSLFVVSPTGEIKGSNTSSGEFKLQADGIFSVNGLTVDLAGNLVTPGNIQGANINATGTITAPTVAVVTSLTINGTDYTDHKHRFTWTSGGGTAFTEEVTP